MTSQLYSDQMLADGVAEFEDIAERYLGVAYRRRTATLSVIATQPGWVVLPNPVGIVVSAVSVDEVALTSGQLAALHPVGDDSTLRGGNWGTPLSVGPW